MAKKIDIVIFFILFHLGMHGQTGPGGVGKDDGTSHLVLWLDANTVQASSGSLVNVWPDRSGYGRDFNEGNGAVFYEDVQNGNAAFMFDRSAQHYFQRAHDQALSPYHFTIFAADRVDYTGSWKAVISDRDWYSRDSTAGYILYSRSRRDYEWEFWTGDSTGYGRWGWGVTRSRVSTAGSWASQTITYQPGNKGKKIFVNGRYRAQSTHPYTPNRVRPIRIGAGRNERTDPDYYFPGYIGEIIIFDRVVSMVERIIVQNYLSAKYGFAMDNNDYFLMDEDTLGNFDYHVAGIGQDINGDSHTASQGTGIILIDNPSDLDNGDYLFWGENTKDASYEMTQVDAETYRLNTLWRVSKRNDLGTVSVHFNETDISFDPSVLHCATLKLVVSANEDFSAKRIYPLT
ncbi:MAG: LamG domain-containing protein, partial [Chlorobi bacterium]|nr:LamG domain-containing protein [Chlorobiota bacterium]